MDFRQLQGSRATRNRHVNGDPPDYPREVISMVLDDDGSLIVPDWHKIRQADHMPPPKTTKCMQHTVAQHDSPAVFAKLKSQLQRERHPLNEVASKFNSFHKSDPRVSCKKDEVLKHFGSGRRRLINGQGCSHLVEKPSSSIYDENDVQDTSMEDFVVVRNSLPDNDLDITNCRADVADCQTVVDDPLPCHNLPRTRISNNHVAVLSSRVCVSLERLPQSPAKLFVYLKERERNRHIQKGCKAEHGTMMIQNRGTQDGSTFTAFSNHPMELKTSMNDVGSVPESAEPVVESRLEGADDPCGDVQPFVVDPLLVNSPRVRFRKRCQTQDVHKVPTKPSEDAHQQGKVTGVYLTKWVLKSDSNGLHVSGIRKHRVNNVHWESSSIVKRVSNSVLKTFSGTTYHLVGKMTMLKDSEFPRWFLEKFAYGFPEDWRMFYEKFISESINFEEDGKVRVVKRPSEKGVTNHSVSVERKRRNVVNTSVSCHPSSSSEADIKVSRSGRMIKPPLDYWRGGRIIMDKDMNMTIHESYETTVSLPQDETRVTVSRPKLEAVSCRPTSSSEADTKVSRSGRMIKPPLDYWRGGRVIMDKDMNMTIQNSYETTVSLPHNETRVAVSRPNCEEKERSERSSSEVVPLRKGKTSPRHRDRAWAKPGKQTGRTQQATELYRLIPRRKKEEPAHL